MLIASIILYLLGWVACYFLCRNACFQRYRENKWKAMDKLVTIVMCFLSWITIFIFLLFFVLVENGVFNPDKEITW